MQHAGFLKTNIHYSIRDKVSFAVLINYTLLSVVVVGFDETYPLWAANSPELDMCKYVM